MKIKDMLRLDGRVHDLKGATLDDAIKQGWRVADTTWTRGYMSRKLGARSDDEIHVYEAGGCRTGYIAYYTPSFKSTSYYHITYLYHEDVYHA